MANQVGDRARFYINSSTAQNKLLRRVESVKETDNRDAEHVFNPGENKPAGVIRKPGGGELELTVYEEQGTPEVDWEALQDSGEYFSMTRDVVRGRRTQFLECTVANVAFSSDEQGKHMLTVKIIWSERKRL